MAKWLVNNLNVNRGSCSIYNSISKKTNITHKHSALKGLLYSSVSKSKHPAMK